VDDEESEEDDCPEELLDSVPLEHLLEEVDTDIKRTKQFVLTRVNIQYVCTQIRRHDLGFLLEEVIPEIPDWHVYVCMETIWEMMYILTENISRVTILPLGLLNIEPFRKHPKVSDGTNNNNTFEKLLRSFVGYKDPSKTHQVREE
jgi:hypothetical protein